MADSNPPALCEVCGTPMPEYNPGYCCDGAFCGCHGRPTNPPVCSQRCMDYAMRAKPAAPITLSLVLTRHWFREILLGNKLTEYRRICPSWTNLIWNRRDRITRVCFREAYTKTSTFADVLAIDIGPCPIPGWHGDFYRIHLFPLRSKQQETPACHASPGT